MLAFLLTLAQEEDHEFVTELFNTYKKQMWFKANELLHDNNLSEDAVQAAFTGIINNIETVRNVEDKALPFYLFEAAKNAAIDIIRKNNKIAYAEKLYNITFGVQPDLIEALQNHKELVYSINQLPDNYKTVLSLYIVFGLPEKDIASELDLTVNNVRQRVFRGKKMLKEIYEKELMKTDE